MDELHPDSAVIDRLGGSTEVAKLCRIRSQAVSQWRRHGIPPARHDFLRLLRPEAFDPSDGAPSIAVTQEARDAA